MITAVVPIKDTKAAKHRLAGVLSSAQRQELALAMCQDVLTTLAAVPALGRILVVTVDPAAAAVAASYGAEVTGDGAHDGHTGAVAAAARLLAGDDMLQVPSDIPLVEPDDISRLIAAHDADRRAFTIVPARDQRGSNAVLCSPADAVPLRFGENSFFPHLAAARACGIEPKVVRLPRIALDIDTPDDLALLRATLSLSRASALLDAWVEAPA